MDEGSFVIKYSECPEVDSDTNGVTTVTTTKVIIESGTTDKLSRIVTGFVDDGEEVEVLVKHKPMRE